MSIEPFVDQQGHRDDGQGRVVVAHLHFLERVPLQLEILQTFVTRHHSRGQRSINAAEVLDCFRSYLKMHQRLFW